MATIEVAVGGLTAAVSKMVSGDTLKLAPGDHGKLSLYAKKFPLKTTIMGGPGVKLAETVVNSCEGLTFRWINFRGLSSSNNVNNLERLVDVNLSKRIDFIECSFAAAEDSSAWTPQQWATLPHNGALLCRGEDINVIGCRFFNNRSCLGASALRMTVQGNIFEDFGIDGIQVGNSQLRIIGNIIRNGRHTAADPLHADAIQGYPAGNDGTHSDVYIAGNTIIPGDRADYQQGLSAFDGRWANVTVRDNIVGTTAYHGITWFGVDGITIENNTVLDPWLDDKVVPWIQVTKSKTGRASTNITVTGNTAPKLMVDAPIAGRPETIAKVTNNTVNGKLVP